MTRPPSSPLSVHLTLSGRPLAKRFVQVTGLGESFQTDERGHVGLDLPNGPVSGRVDYAGDAIPFELVNAVGLRRVRVDLRLPERPLDDPAALAAMPSERYVPLSLIGQGSAGRVYRCRDTSLDRLVAIKILHEDFAGLEANNAAFLTEARRLAQVSSPHLIDIYDVGLHGPLAYMVVEYIDGPNLDELRLGEQTLSSATLAAAGVQLAQALLAIHEAGLLHRDVKPSNGLVDRRGVVHLADFGLARPMIDLSDPQSRVFGTPPFMSPEQLQGQPLGPAADIYSLGASLFDMAVGHPPFYKGDLLLSVLFDNPPNLRERRDDVPETLARLVSAMLGKKPDDRPHAADVIDALLPLAADAPREPSQPYLPRLSGSAFGLRWLAGPTTRQLDRLKGDGADADLDEEGAGDGVELDEDADLNDGGDASEAWGEEETRVMATPPALEPVAVERAAPDSRPTPAEFAVVTSPSEAVRSGRDRIVSFAVGLLAGLVAAAVVMAILG